MSGAYSHPRLSSKATSHQLQSSRQPITWMGVSASSSATSGYEGSGPARTLALSLVAAFCARTAPERVRRSAPTERRRQVAAVMTALHGWFLQHQTRRELRGSAPPRLALPRAAPGGLLMAAITSRPAILTPS